jgi:hypothetical protein|nr:MAG TPA: hypothetical protein [Bacteriophage sp.]
MDRDCKNCVYHSSGSYSQWDCNFTTINDVRNKTVDDFVKAVKKHNWNIRNRNENEFIYGAIDEIAEQLKAGGNA